MASRKRELLLEAYADLTCADDPGAAAGERADLYDLRFSLDAAGAPPVAARVAARLIAITACEGGDAGCYWLLERFALATAASMLGLEVEPGTDEPYSLLNEENAVAVLTEAADHAVRAAEAEGAVDRADGRFMIGAWIEKCWTDDDRHAIDWDHVWY